MISLIFDNIGKIFSVKDAIARVTGLDTVTSGEMVSDVHGYMGLALNLESGWTGIVMFDDNIVMAGDLLSRTFKTLNILIDLVMLGLPLSPLGAILSSSNKLLHYFIDKISFYFGKFERGVELKAPGIIVREPVYESLNTGILGIDAVFPLGFGQRELIIGDRQTGKTTLAVDSFLNQSAVNVWIYKYFIRGISYFIDKNIG